MPSTVYKGDLVEASFGHESGMVLHHDFQGASGSFRFHAFDVDTDAGEGTDYSTLYFSGGASDWPVDSGVLAYPVGMLVGSQLIFRGLTQSNPANGDTKFDKANNASEGKIFTIIEHTYDHSNTRTQLRIHPPLVNQRASGGAMESTEGAIEILPFKTPTMDTDQQINNAANASAERVMTDQFVGIVNTITLPETKVDLKRFHVVGLGRDVAIQTPGRFLNQGGSFEANLHNSRWLYYCLGSEVTKPSSHEGGENGNDYRLNVASHAGTSMIVVGQTNGSNAPTQKDEGDNQVGVTRGDYIYLNDADTVDVDVHMGGIAPGDTGVWPTNYVEDGKTTTILSRAKKKEVRRVVSVVRNSPVDYIWLDDPLNFAHDLHTPVKFIRYLSNGDASSPHFNSATASLENPVNKMYFSKDTVPSFALEVSIRRRDVDDGTPTTEATGGGINDSKQLTRVFRGCKIKDWSVTADTDAALRLTANFDAALCYTDTGRLESTKGDRYDTHRLFEDAQGGISGNWAQAAQLSSRKEMGLAKGTQKPFMFYNGTIRVAGVTLGQVVSFTLNGKTGVEQHYTINGVTTADASTDQVPFAGTRNASIAVEGKTEYDLEMEIIVDDPVFYHNMRRSIHNHDEDTTDKVDTDVIRLSFTKQGTGASSAREQLDFVIDDYYITEAPLPIPEDKGPIKSTLKIMPKSVKVVARDTILHA